MKKLKILLLALAATISVGAWAETDVTNLLNDAAIASEANWGGGNSSGGNHSRNAAGYWESWHNTFNLTQTINSLDAGYYMVSIQGVVENGSTTTAVLTATSGNNTATAYLRNNTRGDFNENALALKASPNLHRSYATVKVAKGGSLTISFKQTANNQWIVYGQFKLHKLTAAEGINQQALETALSGKSWGVTESTGAYHGLNERYNEPGAGGDVIFNKFENMPKGIYEVSATAAASYTSGRGFDGKTGDNLTVFRANGVDVNVPVEDRAAVDYSAYGVYTAKCSVGDDGILKFGLFNLVDNGGNWFIYGVNNLVYENLESALTTVRSKAKAIIDAEPKMNSMVWNNLNTEYSNSENVSEDKMSDAIESLDNTIDNANASIGIYASIQKWYDDAKANLSDEGYNKFVEETSAIKSAYDGGTITDGVEENATLKSKYEEFIKIYYAPGADITDIYIKNAKLLNGQEGWNCNPNTYSDNFAAQNNGNIGVLEFYAGYGSLSLNKYEMLQTLRLPAGEYKLSSNAFFRQGEKFNTDKTKSLAYMKCGNDQTLLPTLGSVEGLGSYANNRGEAISAFENGLYETSTTFKLLESSDVTVGYVGTFDEPKSWFISGPLKLVYVGPVSLVGYIDDISATLTKVPKDKMEKTLQEALNAAVETAKEILAKYDADPTSVTAKEANDACEALKVAINNAEPSIKVYKSVKDAADAAAVKAEALDTDGQKKFDELIEDVMTAYEAGTITDGVAELAAINSALVDATKAQTSVGSDWSILGSNLKDDWAGASGTYQTGVELYTGDGTPGEAKVLLSQTIEGLMPGAKYEVKFYAAANVARNLSAENYGDGIAYVFANNEKKDITVGQLNAGSFTTDEYLRTFEAAVGADGKLEFGLGNKKVGGQWYIAQFVSLKLVALPSTANMTVKENAKWGTFCAPFDVTIPDGVKAYTAVEDDNTVAFKEVETTIPAGTPVVVYSATSVDENFVDAPEKTGETCNSGALVGVYAATSGITAKTGHTNYVLQNNAQGVGFYKVAEGSTISLNANRCYMTLPTLSAAKDCVVLDGIVTGINNILNPTDKSAEGIYDLNGRKLAAPQKGINIINGVKVIVK